MQHFSLEHGNAEFILVRDVKHSRSVVLNLIVDFNLHPHSVRHTWRPCQDLFFESCKWCRNRGGIDENGNYILFRLLPKIGLVRVVHEIVLKSM